MPTCCQIRLSHQTKPAHPAHRNILYFLHPFVAFAGKIWESLSCWQHLRLPEPPSLLVAPRSIHPPCQFMTLGENFPASKVCLSSLTLWIGSPPFPVLQLTSKL